MRVKKSAAVLATLAASASMVVGGAVAAQSETTTGLRGQATIFVDYRSADPGTCGTTPAAPTTTVHVNGFVRYPQGFAWHARRGTTVHIQKRTSTGSWITVNKANTGWEKWELEEGKGYYFDQFLSNVPTASKRVFRLYVPKTDKYQAVYSRSVTAVPICAG